MQLSARNAQLESELEALRSANSAQNTTELRREFSDRLGQVEGRLRAMTQERDALKKEIDTKAKMEAASAGQREKELQDTLASTRNELAEAKKAEAVVREEGLGLAAKIGKLEGLLKGVRAQLAEKSEKLEKETQRAADAEGKLAETSAALSSVKAELQRWEGSAEGLKAVSVRATTELQELRASEADLKRRLAESQQQLESAWGDLAQFRKDSGLKTTEAIEAVQREAAEAREKWKKHAQQRDMEWGDREKALKESLQALRAEVARKEESYEWRIHAASERERELKSRLEQVEGSLLEERAARAQAQAPLVEELQRLRKTLNEAEDRVNGVRNEWRANVEELDAKVRQAREASEALTAELSKAKEANAGLMQRCARLESKCAEATASAELERTKCDEQREEGETQRALARRYKEELDSLKKDAQRWKEETTLLRSQMESATQKAQQGTDMPPSPIGRSSNHDTSTFASPMQFDRSVLPISVSTTARLERELEMMQEELIRYSREARECKQKLLGMAELERMLADLGMRHAVALEMLGEREAEVKALKEDLEEVKENFRQQLVTLLK